MPSPAQLCSTLSCCRLTAAPDVSRQRRRSRARSVCRPWPRCCASARIPPRRLLVAPASAVSPPPERPAEPRAWRHCSECVRTTASAIASTKATAVGQIASRGRGGSSRRALVPADLDQVAIGIPKVHRRHGPERPSARHRPLNHPHPAGAEVLEERLRATPGHEAQVRGARASAPRLSARTRRPAGAN
jgi:hypothetical protein